MTDQDLPADVVERARQGDPRAFESIVRTFDGPLRALAYRLLGPMWSEDVLQEAYVRAFRALPNFEPGVGTLGGWLYRIVYRGCLDQLRRSGRETWGDEDVYTALSDLASTTEGEVTTRMNVWAALGTLTPEERACVVLVDGFGFDYDSTGRVLGVPRGTVASRLHHARPIIRQQLEDDLENEEGGRHARA
jgi:RNA polymerase sigma-70 factor (ECF subfamily)